MRLLLSEESFNKEKNRNFCKHVLKNGMNDNFLSANEYSSDQDFHDTVYLCNILSFVLKNIFRYIFLYVN